MRSWLPQSMRAAILVWLSILIHCRSCILAAAHGCLVLVKPAQPQLVDQETEPAAARLPGEVVVRIASTLFRDVPIGSLSHDNRRACLQLMLALIQVEMTQINLAEVT